MAIFITLTDLSGGNITVNVNLIQCLRPINGNQNTHISIIPNKAKVVVESVATILAMYQIEKDNDQYRQNEINRLH